MNLPISDAVFLRSDVNSDTVRFGIQTHEFGKEDLFESHERNPGERTPNQPFESHEKNPGERTRNQPYSL